VGLDGEDLKPGKIPINPPEAVKKSLSPTFVPKDQLDLQSFRMRSLRLKVTCHNNKDMWLRGILNRTKIDVE